MQEREFLLIERRQVDPLRQRLPRELHVPLDDRPAQPRRAALVDRVGRIAVSSGRHALKKKWGAVGPPNPFTRHRLDRSPAASPPPSEPGTAPPSRRWRAHRHLDRPGAGGCLRRYLNDGERDQKSITLLFGVNLADPRH